MPGGRPTNYNLEIGTEICGRLIEGVSLAEICRSDDMPGYRTIMTWLIVHEEFRHNYERAREEQAHADADAITDIADRTLRGEFDPAAARVAIDARKWTAGRRLPKKYGDRATYEHTGKDGGPIETMEITDAERARALAVFIARTKVETK